MQLRLRHILAAADAQAGPRAILTGWQHVDRALNRLTTEAALCMKLRHIIPRIVDFVSSISAEESIDEAPWGRDDLGFGAPGAFSERRPRRGASPLVQRVYAPELPFRP